MEMQAHLGLCVTTSVTSQTSKQTHTNTHIFKQSPQTHKDIHFSFIRPLENDWTVSATEPRQRQLSYNDVWHYSLCLVSSGHKFTQNHTQRKTHIHTVHPFIIFIFNIKKQLARLPTIFVSL